MWCDLEKTCNFVSIVNAFLEVAYRLKKLVCTSLPFLVQKPKNVKANLMFKLLKITEKGFLVLCHVKQGLQSWGKEVLLLVSIIKSWLQ